MNNILFLTTTPIWSLDNKVGAPSCFNTIQGYADRGWNTYLISTNAIDKRVFRNVNIIPLLSTHSVSTVYKTKNKIIKFFQNLRYSLGVRKAFVRLGKDLLMKLDCKSTIVYAYEVHAVAAGKYLSNKFKTPLVTRFQGTIMYNKRDNLINHIGYYPHYQALKEPADLIIMTNDGTCGDLYLRRIGNNSKLMFLRNGVDISVSSQSLLSKQDIYNKLGLNGDEIVLMTLSRLVNWKRIDRAIVAFSEVVKKRNKCRLVIVGDGDAKSNLERLSEELNVRDKVVFAGGVPQKDVASYLQIADIFLSLYDLGNAGNPTFEAMKCSKPIIALDNGNTKEVLTNGSTALLIAPEKESEISEKILYLLDHAEERIRIGNNARIFADQNFYSWETRIDMECNEVVKLLH